MQNATATLPPPSRHFLEWAARRLARKELSYQVVDEGTVVMVLHDVLTRRMVIGFHQGTPVLGFQKRDFDAISSIMWAGVDTEVFQDEAALVLRVAMVAPATIPDVDPKALHMRIPATPPGLVPVVGRALERVGRLEMRLVAVNGTGAAAIQPCRPVHVNFAPYSGNGD